MFLEIYFSKFISQNVFLKMYFSNCISQNVNESDNDQSDSSDNAVSRLLILLPWMPHTSLLLIHYDYILLFDTTDTP